METIARKKCVFVLEDDEDLRELFEFLLRYDDFDVKTYADATSFRTGIHDDLPRPNLILMDIRLPDGNGLDICRELKSDPELKDIPVIMMSAHMDKAEVIGKCGSQDFLQKPFDIKDFIRRVEQFA
ncbi:MAG: response regulator [Pedobacter sp.]|nr:MAG: response regulator [Pedobacter sp.]